MLNSITALQQNNFNLLLPAISDWYRFKCARFPAGKCIVSIRCCKTETDLSHPSHTAAIDWIRQIIHLRPNSLVRLGSECCDQQSETNRCIQTHIGIIYRHLGERMPRRLGIDFVLPVCVFNWEVKVKQLAHWIQPLETKSLLLLPRKTADFVGSFPAYQFWHQSDFNKLKKKIEQSCVSKAQRSNSSKQSRLGPVYAFCLVYTRRRALVGWRSFFLFFSHDRLFWSQSAKHQIM